MRKVTITMRVAVHPIQAALWEQRDKIEPGMPLRKIGKLVGVEAPQQIKNHLTTLVNIGAIDYIEGQYVFPEKVEQDK